MQYDKEETDKAIGEALQKLENDKSKKPTQSVLAKLAGVSRGTLNHERDWALQRLKEIKENRKVKAVAKDNITPLNKEKRLEQELSNCREENAILFYELEKYKRLLDEKNARIEEVARKNQRLQDSLRELKLEKLKQPSENIKVIDIKK